VAYVAASGFAEKGNLYGRPIQAIENYCPA
jgi:hypothetical protein